MCQFRRFLRDTINSLEAFACCKHGIQARACGTTCSLPLTRCLDALEKVVPSLTLSPLFTPSLLQDEFFFL